MSINPHTLRALRLRRNLSQDNLARLAKVSKKTIARLEAGNNGNAHSTERLAEALRVKVEELSRELIEPEETEKKLAAAGFRPLKSHVSGEAALAFQIVEDIYGIPMASQVEIAPLLCALLAQASLKQRRTDLDAIEEATMALSRLSRSHVSFVQQVYRVEDGISAEDRSISINDIFGKEVSEEAFRFGFDPTKNNPFADYLRNFAKLVGTNEIQFDPDAIGELGHNDLPSYRVGPKRIEELTDGDYLAEYALLRGHAKMADIPTALLEEGADKRRAQWLISRIPEVERQRLEEEAKRMDKIFKGLNLTLPKKDDDHAS